MASVFKRYDRRLIPEGAEITSRRKEKVVRFKNDRGRIEVRPLSQDGTRTLVERRAWYVAYVDASSKRQIVKGYSDREASEKLGRDLEREAARRKAGLPTADREKTHAPIAKALELYLEDLERQGTSDSYRYNTRKTMERLVRECAWSTMPTIRATSWLASARREGKAPRTLNYYLDTASKFVAWCVDKHYLEGAVPWLISARLMKKANSDGSAAP